MRWAWNIAGIEYQVVAVTAKYGAHGGWKWSVRIDPYIAAAGTEASRDAAMATAEKKIDMALNG
jgi:hypothetical protein